MQVVRFTYDSTEVRTSVFLFLYLRMSGIYIFERYFNLEPSVCSKMLNALPDSEIGNAPEAYDDYDMELYLVRNEDEFRAFWKYGYTHKTILLVLTDKWMENFAEELDEDRTVKFSQSTPPDVLLKQLLDCIYKNNLISHKTFDTLNTIADVYCANDVMELTLSAKYFYTEYDLEQYNNNVERYKNIGDCLFRIMAKMDIRWGDTSCIHLQYAALHIAYEGNLYCLRHKKPFLFTPDSMAKVCETLLSNRDVLLALGDSIHLLAAQIYGDLTQNTHAAYEHYLSACKSYSAYAYYKKAMHLMEIEQNYQMAIKYLSKSLIIYPSYYRAWHMLGICFMNERQWEKAVKAFDNLEVILAPRLKNMLLRPMEIEYLFKAASQAGEILFREMQQILQAVDRYLFAERVWKAIDDTEFIALVYQDYQAESRVRSRIKEELNIKAVYARLAEIYKYVGDDEKMMFYQQKMYM